MLPLLDRDFSVLANRSVSFTLFSSRTRHDAHGDIVALDEAEVDHHPPLVTLLRYGRRLRERRLNVRLRASFTEVGTLELWFESPDTPHRWRLQFELRGEAEQAPQPATTKSSSAAPHASGDTNSDTAIESAVKSIRSAFGKSMMVTLSRPRLWSANWRRHSVRTETRGPYQRFVSSLTRSSKLPQGASCLHVMKCGG